MQDTMRIQRVCRGQDEQAEGIVIVIDVIRAFTVAAYAFNGPRDAQRGYLAEQ